MNMSFYMDCNGITTISNSYKNTSACSIIIYYILYFIWLYSNKLYAWYELRMRHLSS